MLKRRNARQEAHKASVGNKVEGKINRKFFD
jgi:hypothetical protein